MSSNGRPRPPAREGPGDTATGIFHGCLLGILLWVALVGAAYGVYRLLQLVWP